MTNTQQKYEAVRDKILDTIAEWQLHHDSLSYHRDNHPEVIDWLYGVLII